MKKTLLCMCLLSAATSLPALAVTASITQTMTAKTVLMMSNNTGPVAVNNFSVSATDFKSGELSKPKKLTMLRFSIAAYPEATSDTVELCYFRAYSTSALKCIPLNSGVTSSTNVFNSLPFDHGASVQVRHTLTGEHRSNLKPSRQESLTFEYSY